MIQLDLKELRRHASNWHKVLSVTRDQGKITLTVIRGLSLTGGPKVISEEFQLKSAPEVDDYLTTGEFQRKLFQPSKRGILLVDVADYSRYDTAGQSAILTMFYESLQLAEFSNDLFSGEPSIDQIVPTGDGCFIVFKADVSDRVFKSVFSIHASFCAYQKRLLNRSKAEVAAEIIGIRLACHVGDVDFIVDSAGNRNAYGTGLNETARVLQYGRAALKKRLDGNDPVSVAFYRSDLHSQAEALVRYFRQLPDVQARAIDLGTVTTKHDHPLELRCIKDLPRHILFPFNSPIPQEKSAAWKSGCEQSVGESTQSIQKGKG
jgi:hypothetical protein